MATSLAGTYILLNQNLSSKQTLASVPTQLEEGNVKLQAVKAEKQTIEEKLVASTIVSIPPTPTVPFIPEPFIYKRTMTLPDIKVLVEDERKRCVDKGWTEAATKELLTGMAIELGTTLEELANIQVSQAPVAPKAVVKQPTQSTQPSKPSTSTAKPSTSTAKPSTGVNPYDKNGNGIEDSFEANHLEAGGTTSDPNFIIHAINNQTIRTSLNKWGSMLSRDRTVC